MAYDRMASAIKTFVYTCSPDDADDDFTEVHPVSDNENQKDKAYLPDINSDSVMDGETDLNESLLRSGSFASSNSVLSRTASVKARNSAWDEESENQMICSSVARKAGSKELVFKYKSCSICLCDFANKERVRVVPKCGHTFHEECLESWLQKRFRCPNCNTDIQPEDG